MTDNDTRNYWRGERRKRDATIAPSPDTNDQWEELAVGNE